MTKQRLDEAREIKEKETLYNQWEYGVGIQSMIDELILARDEAIGKGAILDTISLEMETHYGYYDDRYHEWVLHYARKESQKEIDKRVMKTEKKRERDRENARKSRAKAKIDKEEADRKEYKRLKEKYEKEGA
jgi:hypothetical protein